MSRKALWAFIGLAAGSLLIGLGVRAMNPAAHEETAQDRLPPGVVGPKIPETMPKVAPGGFVELSTSTGVRPLLTAVNIATLVPKTRSSFIFPAPYGTQGFRLTLPSDCGDRDCVEYIGYSYWRRINNHVGSTTLDVFVTLNRTRGGVGPALFSIDKDTGVVSFAGPLFDESDRRSWGNGEGWYFSASDPSALYLADFSRQLDRYDVRRRVTTTVFDVQSIEGIAAFGPGRLIWQAHSSNDDRVHSFTVKTADNVMLGCGVYVTTPKQFRFFPALAGGFDECEIDKSGRYLIIIEQVDGRSGEDNRIIDLETSVETRILDEQGAGGHSDTGYGTFLAADNWFPGANAIRAWELGTSPLRPGTVVYRDPSWASESVGHLSFLNAVPGPLNSQYACGSNAASKNGPRSNEIVCFLLDGSLRTLVVAPNLTNLNAPGGGDNYAKLPKGNIDITGQYFIWTANLAGNRLDAFVVRVPAHVLTPGSGARFP